jgi:thiol-disulfide isomerase/thioredoxin
MKKRTQIVVLILTLFTMNRSLAQKTNEYIIRGNISNLKSGIIIYLIKSDGSNGADTISSQQSTNGKFLFRGKLEKEGEFYFVKIDTTDLKLPKERNTWIRLLMENHTYQISGQIENWPEVTIKGNIDNKIFDSLNKVLGKYQLESSARIKTYKKDSILIENEMKRYQRKIYDLINSNKNTFVTPIIILNSGIQDNMFYKNNYESLSTRFKNSFYGVQLKEFIKNQEIQSKIKQGLIIPNFWVSTIDGKKLSILEVASSGKLTLIDFWASWCKPCREEIPNLLDTYNKFHDKGFNIVGISCDQKLENWKKAVAEDKTPWLHTIQNEQRVDELIFALQSIPGYVLIDNYGKLLAFDRGFSVIASFGPRIRGEELSKTIKQLLTEIN